MIPYARQNITQADIDAVSAVLRSDFLTQGSAIPLFEKTVADFVGVKHAIAVCNATSALHIACLALGLGAGDILWTSPITFVASANCGLYCGAEVDFVDIDEKTYNICPKALAKKLEQAKIADKLPKIVVAVHLCGHPCYMAEIHKLSQEYGFKIIEDASHAIGGKYRNEYIGNGRYSDITIFSFHPVKIITTGEGGMALTNDEKFAENMALLRSHGITRNPAQMVGKPDGSWYYEQIMLGFNYRMTDIQAALGISQMARIESFIARRHEIAKRYDELLCELPVITPFQHTDAHSAFHLYVIRLKLDEIKKNHCEVFDALRTAGIGVNLHYMPVYQQPYYEKIGFDKSEFSQAEKYYAEAISLPMYPDLTNAMQDEVINALREVLKS